MGEADDDEDGRDDEEEGDKRVGDKGLKFA